MVDVWVFAYGSLMWNPGFSYEEVRRATITGYQRCFCIYSVHHRGTARRPGLVLGLDRGGVCHGLAYRIAGSQHAHTIAYLRAREQVSGVYREVRIPMQLDGGLEVDGLAFVAERAHPNFSGRLPLQVQAEIIRAAVGRSGTNLDYLTNTLAHLVKLGIRERELERLLALTGPIFTRGSRSREPGGSGQTARCRSLVQSLGAQPPRARVMKPGDRKRFLHRQSQKP
jgi:glutathione-specific gamma-glutamylcyclotransferase